MAKQIYERRTDRQTEGQRDRVKPHICERGLKIELTDAVVEEWYRRWDFFLGHFEDVFKFSLYCSYFSFVILFGFVSIK